MKVFKLISRLFFLTLCLAMLLGCRDNEPPSTAADAGKVLRVAFEGMTVPCNWTQDTDAHGAVPIKGSKQFLCGFEVDYMKRVCELAGYRLEAYKFDWSGMLMAVSTGKADCAISMIVVTPERNRSIDFTKPYYYGETVGVVRKDSKYASARSVQDLKGARATSMQNTLWYTTQIDRLPEVKKLLALENVPALVVALQSGAADLILLDRPTAQGVLIANPDLFILPFSGTNGFNATLEETACTIALPKGQEKLRARLEAAMAKITPDEVEKMIDAACRNQPLNKLN